MRRSSLCVFLTGIALGMLLLMMFSGEGRELREALNSALPQVTDTRPARPLQTQEMQDLEPTRIRTIRVAMKDKPPVPVPSFGSSASSGNSRSSSSSGGSIDDHSSSISDSSSSSSDSSGIINSNGVTLSNALGLTYPAWWMQAWNSSATAWRNEYLGDKPFIHPPCQDQQPAKDGSYKFVEPKPYIKKSKNPCWWEPVKNQRRLRCVPYFYLIGVAKCGTTDLYKRMGVHPDLLRGVQKEYHFWDRCRYNTGRSTGQVPVREYLQQITGDSLPILEKEIKQQQSTKKIFGDFSPSYFFHPVYWPQLDGNQGCQEPRVTFSQHMYHLYPEAKIIITFRHPTPRLYSRFLSRIPRTDFLKTAGPNEFHTYAQEAVQTYRSCFGKWSVRHCVYNGTLYGDVTTRLLEGMYPTLMADWLRVFPRKQMHIMRYEDYGGHEEERITEIFDFLGLDRLNKTVWAEIAEKPVQNSGSLEYKTIGQMLPETKKLLDDFYQPFINQFAEILNDKRFLWLDTNH